MQAYEISLPHAPFDMIVVPGKNLVGPIRKCSAHSAQVALCLEYLGVHFLVHITKLDVDTLEVLDEKSTVRRV